MRSTRSGRSHSAPGLSHLWLKLPEDVDAGILHELVEHDGVLFETGGFTSSDERSNRNHIRLGNSIIDESLIPEGIDKIAGQSRKRAALSQRQRKRDRAGRIDRPGTDLPAGWRLDIAGRVMPCLRPRWSWPERAESRVSTRFTAPALGGPEEGAADGLHVRVWHVELFY